MSFDWNGYYLLAVGLRNSADESSLRSAISRVYYSVYCQARNFLIDRGQIANRYDNSHKHLWNHYRNGGRTSKSIGFNDGRLHENRKAADYENDVQKLNELVDESFQYADKILLYLNQMRNASR